MAETPVTEQALPSLADLESAPIARGASPRAQAAAALVSALSKAARAFTLYDPGNSLIRQFLGDYRARAAAATALGDVPLDVRPFELALGGEVVYREEDRERSVAFKLFRDGIRKLSFLRGVDTDELLRLLQILAIRFVGVRQAEDDVVTLLRKAEFKCITCVAVEGYASEDEDPLLGVRRRGGEPPPGFDTPFPRLPPPGPVGYARVPDEALAALRAEEAPEALSQSGLRLAAELIAWAGRGAIPAGDAARFCAELRDFLLADKQLGVLASLADLAQRQPAGPLRDELLRGLADARLLDAVLASLPPGGDARLPADAARLIPFVPAVSVLERLAAEESAGRRAALLEIISARMPADAEAVAAKVCTLPAAAARAVLAVLMERAREHADQARLALLEHPDLALQLDALRALAASPQPIPSALLTRLLASPEEVIRIAAAQALEHHGDTQAARAVADALTSRRSYSRDEAVALGRALGSLHAGAALKLFDGWLEHKKKLLGRLRATEQEQLLQWAAVAGLGVIPGPEPEARLEAVASWADEALRRHVHGTVARRRAEARRHG